ncbi:MAG: hypothetical protein L0099_01480, partial [Acidobacteria bacterium]|nr:hypothetical protein [Acidobacteriota bacterium]
SAAHEDLAQNAEKHTVFGRPVHQGLPADRAQSRLARAALTQLPQLAENISDSAGLLCRKSFVSKPGFFQRRCSANLPS